MKHPYHRLSHSVASLLPSALIVLILEISFALSLSGSVGLLPNHVRIFRQVKVLVFPRALVPVRRWMIQNDDSEINDNIETLGVGKDIVGKGEEREDFSQDAKRAFDDDVWMGAALPLSNMQQIQQATKAVWKALSDGKSRQILKLSLPLIGATEMDDWPGGDRQRYKACRPMVEKILMGLPPSEEGKGTVSESILDEADAVGLIQLECPEAKDDASAIIFPSTDTLALQEQITNSAGPRLVALVNPGWRNTADFGMFLGKRRAEKALEDFEITYSLRSDVVWGYKIRLLYSYPGPWLLFLVDEATGAKELIETWEASPGNKEVEEALFKKKGRPSAADRVQTCAKFFKEGGM
ncbi:unnamed protein product [Choristocarpus tenellus]